MIPADLEARLRDLRGQGEPFVTATVVRTQRPTSAQPGSVAVVRSDGSIEGFVGGVCAEQSVRVYSLRAIESGEPTLLRILPEEEIEDDREEGVVTVHNPCLSGGAIEMFLEPFLPAPRVLVVGGSPIVAALADLGPRLGLELVVGGPGEVTPTSGDLALVVAAHGRDELGALRAGVDAGVPYVGLVASPRRGAAVLDELRADGVPAELVARIDTPAGIDIGARTPPEVALTILVPIVEMRRARDAHVGTLADQAGEAGAAGAQAPATAVDPICGMTVLVDDDTPRVERGGVTTFFCCEGCRERFEQQAA